MSTVPREVEDAFFKSEQSVRVPFVINDSVEIVVGIHGGRIGSVISFVSFDPPVFLVEFSDDGSDEQVIGANLRLLP